MKLYSHQQKILALNPKRHLFAHGTGTGKTITSLELARLNQVDALIIVPKSLKQAWERHVANYNQNHLILTKEQFKKNFKQIPRFNAVIVDEAHYFFGIKSQISKALFSYLNHYKVEYRWLLTATPFMSTPWNIYMAEKLVGRNPSYPAYKAKYFYEINMGGRQVPIQRKGMEPEIAKTVNEIGSTVKIEDCIDMPEQTFEVEYFDVTENQQAGIDSINEINAIVRWTKIHQIMGGTLKGDEYEETQYFKSDKLERLKELVTENERMIVVCRYNAELKTLQKELSKIKKAHIINGEMPGDDRDVLLRSLAQQDEYVLLVNAACAEGWELPNCSIMLFYSHDFSLKNYIQMIGRINRINNPKPNYYVSFVVKDTIDEDVYDSLMRKEDFHIAIYEGSRFSNKV